MDSCVFIVYHTKQRKKCVLGSIMRRKEYFKIRRWTRKYNRKTGVFNIKIEFETAADITERTIAVADAFGLGIDETRKFKICDVELAIGSRDVVYITGDSGSGKSVLLKAMKKDLIDAGEKVIDMNNVEVDSDKPIIETVGETFDEALELLSRVGLNDAFLFLRKYSQLSDGQKYRYRLAKLMESDAQWWLMDEFCSMLDRDTAKIVAYNVQKQARRMSKAVIAATTHTDLFEDLAPNVHIHKRFGDEIEVKYYRDNRAEECSLIREMRIEEGSKEDYKKLSVFHYRSTRAPATLKIFKLMRKDEVVGVIVYSYPPPTVKGRKEALGKVLPIREANEKLATITRVVIHPKYRSIGLGVKLVRDTLPLVGRPYIEAIAVMAKYNPFFEKAGMRKVAVRKTGKSIKEAIEDLEKIGFKRYLLTSVKANRKVLEGLSEGEKEKVKQILLGVKQTHYRRLMATGNIYPKYREFRDWLSRIDNQRLAKALARLAVLAQEKVYLIFSSTQQTQRKE